MLVFRRVSLCFVQEREEGLKKEKSEATDFFFAQTDHS